jgi:hypothetical protein
MKAKLRYIGYWMSPEEKMTLELERIMYSYNFAGLRQIAVNLLSKKKCVKRGIKDKQFLAAMDNNYLTKVLELAEINI